MSIIGYGCGCWCGWGGNLINVIKRLSQISPEEKKINTQEHAEFKGHDVSPIIVFRLIYFHKGL